MHCLVCKVGRKALQFYGNQIPVLQQRLCNIVCPLALSPFTFSALAH